MEARLTALEEGLGHAVHRIGRVEDRVDRLYAQSRVYTIHAKTLETHWVGLGADADGSTMVETGGGEAWLAEALGVPHPLPERQPGRDEMLHGKKARDIHDALWALHEELHSLVRIEPDFGYEERKKEAFTLVYRLGAAGDRVERHVSGCLNAALTAANRATGGNQVLCWSAKTRGEKRKRAWARQAASGADEGKGRGGGGDGGRGKGRGRKGKGGGRGQKGRGRN